MAVDGETLETVSDFIFMGSKITADGDCSHEIKRHLLLGMKVMTNLDSILKSRDITFTKKGPSNQSYVFFSSHVWMWKLNDKEGWVPKNWCFQIVVLEKTLESPLDSKEVKRINLKGNQPWIFIGRTYAKVDAPIFWPPDAKSHHWKKPWWGERLRAGEEGGNRGWDGWMASLTQWTCVWANSGRSWRTGKRGMLQSMGSQSVRHNLVTEQQQLVNHGV